MTAIHETAYPRLRHDWTPKQLLELFSPTEEELNFSKRCTRQIVSRASVLAQLKVFQYLGRFIPFDKIPRQIIAHIVQGLEDNPALVELIITQPKHLKSRYIKSIRKFLAVDPFNAKAQEFLLATAQQAAQIKHHLADIINILLEELVRQRFELPAFSLLKRTARRARRQVNECCYQTLYGQLNFATLIKLDELLTIQEKTTSEWDKLKQEVKRPTPHHVKEFINYRNNLEVLCESLPSIHSLPPAKIHYFFIEAQSMDSAMLKLTRAEKRYALMVIYSQKKASHALDDTADIVIHSVKKLHNLANEALQNFRVSQTTQVERLITHLKAIATAYTQEETSEQKLKALDTLLADHSEQLIMDCDAQLAFSDNNYLPFLLKPYKNRRSSLFDCVTLLPLASTTTDFHLERAVNFMKQHRHTKKRELVLPKYGETGYFSIDWIHKAWLKWVFIPPLEKKNTVVQVNRHYFELCVFSQLALELKSGDLFVIGSDQFADYREQLISWEDYQLQIAEYAEMMKLPAEPHQFTTQLANQLKILATQVDQSFPDNSFVRLEKERLVIKKKERSVISPDIKQLDKLLTERLPQTTILDILVDTEAWLNLSQAFQPVSGNLSRLDNPRERFIMTLFCYGFNFGPTQTMRMVKGFSRRQIAWLNLRHVTEEKLEKAITKTINHYNQFMLPKQWGSGEHASVDGTKWDVYEQNLLSEFHLRYGGYGGIGYYHVSDTYIALFSHFIPCGVYEALYILDGLLKNESDIQPNKIHGDTHSQSYTVFGLAYLLGIELMPRIRHLNELNFYKPDTQLFYQHIEGLFTKSIQWELIEKYLPDMLRVALSIKAGKLTASAILRKLGTRSRKNKLYFAFRELGRVVRTQFLLRYIDDVDLRSIIQAATCKSEEFNQFLKWTFFGGEGVIAENSRHAQRKIIKYNHLVANLILLHNVHSMTRVFNELTEEGYIITPESLKRLAPYRTHHINRFGNHILNLDKIVEPIVEERDFPLKIIAAN